ncbi:MAG: FAD-binding protein [Pseudomonadota bacterium]|nr:FAD-binding protein [Pseudomonadota bacterium]
MASDNNAPQTRATQLDQLPGTGVEPPLVADASSVNWDGEFDVIVVGLGAAGVSAAIEALDRGAKVAFIDRFEGGGTTARSGSVMYAGGGTALQQRLGVNDSPENMFNCLRHEVQDAVSPSTLRKFCEDSPGNFDFVTANGTRYSGTLFPNKTSYPVHGHSLYYSGNELIYTQDAEPAPRGHLADGIKRFTAFGPAFIGPLIRSALKKGVTPIRKSRVNRLILNPAGEVIGVEAQQVRGGWNGFKHKVFSTLASYAQIYFAPAAKGYRKKLFALEQHCAKPVRYRAKGGVVLAAGGFILNKDMTEQYLPKFQRALKLGTTGDTGAGIALGVSAGGAAERLGTATAWRFINPPVDWPKAAIVNLQGKRYVNEAMYGAVIGTRMMAENHGECILVMDKPLFESSLANLNLKHSRFVTWMQAKTAVRTAKSAPTLEALAQRLKVDPQTLQQTVADYNAAARGEQADTFGKQPGDMKEIKQGPFYAINMSAGKGDITSVISLGGLQVCEQTGAVINQGGEPIPGLFAAGRSAIGVASNAYVSGLSIADGVFSGRRAGVHAVQRAQSAVTGRHTSAGQPHAHAPAHPEAQTHAKIQARQPA